MQHLQRYDIPGDAGAWVLVVPPCCTPPPTLPRSLLPARRKRDKPTLAEMRHEIDALKVSRTGVGGGKRMQPGWALGRAGIALLSLPGCLLASTTFLLYPDSHPCTLPAGSPPGGAERRRRRLAAHVVASRPRGAGAEMRACQRWAAHPRPLRPHMAPCLALRSLPSLCFCSPCCLPTVNTALLVTTCRLFVATCGL